jgi:hypothetical protein
MGSTRIEAPEVQPIDIGQQIRETAAAYRQATPDIIAAEEALRGPMQQLALQDYRTALFGGVSPETTRQRDEAQAALEQARTQRADQERSLNQRIDALKGQTGFSADQERERLRQLESDYVGYVGMGDENQAAFQQTLDTIRAELEFDDAQLEERFGASQQERRETEIQNLANELTTLKDSGALSDDAIANLEANFETAADAVLSENPGMLELSRMAVESQFEVGEKLKKAAAENEFRTISELAPDLVDLYRQVDPASTSLADLASKRAEQLASGTPSTAQTGLAELAESIGARAPGGPLGQQVQAGAAELMGREAMGPTAEQQTVAQQIGQLLQGPQAGAAEQALLRAAGQAPSAEAQALGQFGQRALEAGPRGASDVERALQQQTLRQLGFQAAGPSAEEQAIQEQILGLARSAGTLTPEQERRVAQEALALSARQGREMDISAAAGIAGRTSEARRQDQVSDLMAAQQLLGQQQAMQQARTAEELQRMGMGGQMAGTTEAMAQQRLAEQRAMQQMGVGATGTAAQLQAQQAGLSQEALRGAGSLEQARMAQQLQGTGLAQDIAQSGFATQMAGREQQLREFGVGAQEAARLAQQQAQQESALASLYGQQFGMEQQRQAQEGQALGQAFGMQRAMSPDIGAFFGRPASQAAGLQVAGMGQQQAMYGTTPQATDPMLGVNMALQQQANQANLDAAAMAGTAQTRAGLFSGLGQLGAAAIQFCWVAREVYGQNNPMWLLFRGWLLDEAPSWFRKIYIKHGERFAKFISNKPFVKSFIRKWMTSIVKKHYK